MESVDSLIIFSGISFILYGILAFIATESQKEFVRWGFEKQRILIGSLQLFGGLGLLMSLQWNILGAFAAGGLTILMFFGVLVRIRIKDSILQMLPALLFLLLNGFLFYTYLVSI
jgi:hypothetical protein